MVHVREYIFLLKMILHSVVNGDHGYGMKYYILKGLT